jgi:hypothetical protein
MGLAHWQDLLARLYTDAALRERFAADPQAVGREFGLGPEEAARLAELSTAQLRHFAASLVTKRRREVEKQLPLARRALREAVFAELFRRHAAAFHPAGARKHRDDAVAFAAVLERAARAGEIGPAWVADLVRYEAATLVMGDPSRLWAARRFRHSLVDLVRDGLEGGGAPPSRTSLVLWFRLARRGRVRRLVLALPGSLSRGTDHPSP